MAEESFWGQFLPPSDSDPCDMFVKEALKHIGEDGKWTWSTYGWSDIEWCAAFVAAVGQVVGVLNKCIHKTASAQGHGREGVKKKYGTFHKGPSQRGSYIPAVGDLIFFRWNNKYRADEYDCDHVGIVVEVDVVNSKVHTVEGNTGTNNKRTSVVKKQYYRLSSTSISGYFHPNWVLAGGTDSSRYVMNGQLYSSSTTRKDMSVREIGYLDTNYQPSIRSSSIKLSVINYTGLLSALFKLVRPTPSSSTSNTDKLLGNCRIIVDYLISKGLNAAASCGVAGNIFHESSFNTGAIGDNNTSFGICQWHKERGDAMKRMAGSGWANNLTGQLDYLWYELTTGYSSTLSKLKNVANDVEGCRKAADVFVREFEIPSNVDIKSIQRQATAVEYFSQVILLDILPYTQH